jgi:hypothetical protein
VPGQTEAGAQVAAGKVQQQQQEAQQQEGPQIVEVSWAALGLDFT